MQIHDESSDNDLYLEDPDPLDGGRIKLYTVGGTVWLDPAQRRQLIEWLISRTEDVIV